MQKREGQIQQFGGGASGVDNSVSKTETEAYPQEISGGPESQLQPAASRATCACPEGGRNR